MFAAKAILPSGRIVILKPYFRRHRDAERYGNDVVARMCPRFGFPLQIIPGVNVSEAQEDYEWIKRVVENQLTKRETDVSTKGDT